MVAVGTQTTAPQDRRYDRAAIVLHWTIALLILVQIGLGWYMNEILPDHSPAQAQIESLHISVGLTILLLVLVRIGVRLVQASPPLPEDLLPWERWLARFTHALFYLLMLALPLTGWAIVSMGHRPIHFWGIGWPHLPGLGFLAAPANKDLRAEIKHIHVYILTWLVFANLFLHVAGALKAQLGGHPVLWRMLPSFQQKP